MPHLLYPVLNSSLGPRPWKREVLSQCLSVTTCPPGMRNPRSKTGDKWQALKCFCLQRFPQNKTNWVFPTAVALSFLRALSFSQKILQKILWKKYAEGVCFTVVFSPRFQRWNFQIPSNTTVKS